jgi:hypothetical protein
MPLYLDESLQNPDIILRKKLSDWEEVDQLYFNEFLGDDHALMSACRMHSELVGAGRQVLAIESYIFIWLK